MNMQVNADFFTKIKQSGFSITLAGDSFKVSPRNKLTTSQCDFLKLHKAEIVTELKKLQPLNDEGSPGALMVVCFTPRRGY